MSSIHSGSAASQHARSMAEEQEEEEDTLKAGSGLAGMVEVVVVAAEPLSVCLGRVEVLDV